MSELIPGWAPQSKPIRSGKVTAEAAARLPRQTLTRTRTDLIDAAVRIVNEYIDDGPRDGDPPVDVLPFLQLEEVLLGASEIARDRLVHEGGLRDDERVAPLTAGAFYKAFPSAGDQEAGRGSSLVSFRRLVTQEIVVDPLLTDADAIIEMGEHLAATGKDWHDAVSLAVEEEFHRWAKTPAQILVSALALHARDESVGQWTTSVYASELQELRRLYTRFIDLFERRPRPGITVDHIAITVADLIAGMALSACYVPESRDVRVQFSADDDVPRNWHLCAVAAWAIIQGLTEPVPPTED